MIGDTAKGTEPHVIQVFVENSTGRPNWDFERELYRVRKVGLFFFVVFCCCCSFYLSGCRKNVKRKTQQILGSGVDSHAFFARRYNVVACGWLYYIYCAKYNNSSSIYNTVAGKQRYGNCRFDILTGLCLCVYFAGLAGRASLFVCWALHTEILVPALFPAVSFFVLFFVCNAMQCNAGGLCVYF